MITIKPKLSGESFEVGEYYAYPNFVYREDVLRFYHDQDNTQQLAFIELLKERGLMCDIEIKINGMLAIYTGWLEFIQITLHPCAAAYVEVQVIIPPQHA